MLYVDQPVGTGYSYDALVKSTQDLLFIGKPKLSTGITPFEAYKGHVPAENTTFRYGMFPTQDYNKTANTTGIAAVTLWHFSQVWFSAFPEQTSKRVGLFGNSYGGYWVPASAAYMQKQNEKIKNGDISGTIIGIDNIGITNGCIDMLYQAEWYPQMAYNNTYGFQAIPKRVYEKALKIWSKKDGCRDSIKQCRTLAEAYDPHDYANNATVNDVCNEATNICEELLGVFSSKFSLGQNVSPADPLYH
jgi:carboxypeptidase D